MGLGLRQVPVLPSERRNYQVGALLPANDLLDLGQVLMSYRFLADDVFSLKSSKGACAFEQDTLTCGPEVKTPSEFSVCISALTLYTRCLHYTGQGREALLRGQDYLLC